MTANPDGSDVRLRTGGPGYDAEATISEDGSKIVFTSVRDGDLEIYTVDPDGGNVRRLTHEPGYDGDAFFSPDGRSRTTARPTSSPTFIRTGSGSSSRPT